jgi:hypothetical protein
VLTRGAGGLAASRLTLGAVRGADSSAAGQKQEGARLGAGEGRCAVCGADAGAGPGRRGRTRGSSRPDRPLPRLLQAMARFIFDSRGGGDGGGGGRRGQRLRGPGEGSRCPQTPAPAGEEPRRPPQARSRPAPPRPAPPRLEAPPRGPASPACPSPLVRKSARALRSLPRSPGKEAGTLCDKTLVCRNHPFAGLQVRPLYLPNAPQQRSSNLAPTLSQTSSFFLSSFILHVDHHHGRSKF